MQNEIKLKWVLVGSLLTSIGMSFIWPLTSVYLHDRLGISLSMIGIVLFFNSLASVVGSMIGGQLFDRKDPYRLLNGGAVFTLAVLVFLIFFHGWPLFPFALFFLGIGSGWNTTLVSAIGASLKNYDGRYVFNMLYFAQNLGVVIGSSLIGFVYSVSVSLLFVIAAGLYVAFCGITVLTYKPIKKRQHGTHKTHAQAAGMALPKANLLLINSFFAALFFIWVMYQQWVSNLSVYMTSLHIPLSHYSLLWTLNAGLIVVIQLILVRLVNYIKSSFAQISFGLVMLAFSFAILLFARQYSFFVGAMTILTFGEATAFPAFPALINQLTNATVKGRYLGLANAFTSAGRALGPLFGGLIIDIASYKVLFVIAAAVNLLILFALLTVRQKVKSDLHFYEQD